MALDPSIALQSQVPNPANFISSFLDLGQKKLNLDKSRATYDSDVAGQQAISSSAQSRATVDAASVQPLIQQQAANTQGAQALASGQSLATMRAHVANAVQSSSDMLSLPDSLLTTQAVQDSVKTALTNAGAPADAVNQALARVPQTDDPVALRKFLVGSLVKAQGLAGQISTQFPSPQMVNNGQQTQPQTTGNQALTGVAPGMPVGQSTQMQAPPSTPVIKNGIPTILGPQSAQAAGAPTPQTDYAPGQREGVTGPVATNNTHYAQVQQDAAGASGRIATLNNIRQEIPTADMGKGEIGDFLRRITKVFGGAVDANTSQDIMAKNLAVLAAQGGNTDAARMLGEMASPSFHMTGPAAKEAVATLVGIEAKKQAAGAYFAGTPTNSSDYTNKMTLWNKYGDPRAFQYASLPPADQAAMKAKMKAAGTWAEVNNNMIHLNGMGVSP